MKERLKLDAVSLIAIIIDGQSQLIGLVPTGVRLFCLPQKTCPDGVDLSDLFLG